MTRHVRATAPPEYHDNLIPDYGMFIPLRLSQTRLIDKDAVPGCKRLVLDAGYLSSLRRPNNSMNWDGIERITEQGIVTKKGPFHDCIFWTTE